MPSNDYEIRVYDVILREVGATEESSEYFEDPSSDSG